jgi:hypothetical protein
MQQPEKAANGRENGILTPKQESAALALAAGRTIDQAAKASGAGGRTIRTWIHDQPSFSRRIQDLRGEMTSRALGWLVDHMVTAAQTLGNLSSRGTSEMVRLHASKTILELAPKLHESLELERRISLLEGHDKTRSSA